MDWPEPIKKALSLPNGARFYKCALQVNPFKYIRRNNKTTTFKNESEYNNAIISACIREGIEVIGITDHQRCNTGISLASSAREKGIIVFPGAELETKEGVHFLLLFEPDESLERCTGVLGACGIHDQNNPPMVIQFDVSELLEQCVEWGNSICIAAHVASDKGLLRVLDKQARALLWKDRHLLACSLPGQPEDAPENLCPILLNKNPDYYRDRTLAIINAQDVSDPSDLGKPGTYCWIKMSKVSTEGLRQAFLDHQSRVRLSNDPPPEEHTEFRALCWQGGFLDGAAINFNENFNILIGGRGSGKSTIIEGLRYVLGLEPLGEEAKRIHDGIIRQVLRSGTKISLLLRSHHPSKRDYLIERTIPNPPIIRDDSGNVLNLSLADIAPMVEVYGQHEISELTKSRDKLTRLLDRFVDKDESLSKRKSDLSYKLEQSRSRIIKTQKEMSQIENRLAALPGLEETMRRFHEAGLEEKLKERSLLVREERIWESIDERIEPFQNIFDQLKRLLPIDRALISAKALEELPNKTIIAETNEILEKLENDINSLSSQMEDIIKLAFEGLKPKKEKWEEQKQYILTGYEKILRELQKSKIDGEEFIRLREQIEELRPLKERQVKLERDKKEYEQEWRNMLSEWEDVKAKEFRAIERAAKKVNKKLEGRVSVNITAAGNREPLIQLLRNQIGGRLSEAIDILTQRPELSLTNFASACRRGRDSLSNEFSIPLAQADKIADASSDVIMQIEELDMPPTTEIKLNIASDDQTPQWQSLDDLSTGQKATAILLLLLLESQASLIVDQPEDDLDNRFISDGIVPKMREEKRFRQFIFSTHNANIPVLGDAELIIGLSAFGETGDGTARLPPEHMGSIDLSNVRELVEEILEGGKDAFEMRRLKYGF